MASRSRHFKFKGGVCLHDRDAQRKPCELESPHEFSKFEKCGIVGGTTGVELLLWGVSFADLQMHMCGSVGIEQVWTCCFRGSIVMFVLQFLTDRRQDASVNIFCRAMLDLGMFDVYIHMLGVHLPFLDPLHVYRTPLSARTHKRPRSHGFATVAVLLCCLSTSAMGLSIWASTSHMHLEDLGTLKRSTIPSPEILRALYESLQTGNIMSMLRLRNGAQACMETSST